MIEENVYTGRWIPGEVDLNKQLSSLDKHVFCIIFAFDKKRKGCFATNKYFAYMLDAVPTSISKSIKKLVLLQYINSSYSHNSPRTLKINPFYTEKYKHLINNHREKVTNWRIKNYEGGVVPQDKEGCSTKQPYYNYYYNKVSCKQETIASENGSNVPLLRLNKRKYAIVLKLKRRQLTSLQRPLGREKNFINTFPPEYKSIISLWNEQPNLQHLRLPTKNKPDASKTLLRTMTLLKEKLKTQSIKKIKHAILVYNSLLGPDYILKNKLQWHRVSLGDFFKLSFDLRKYIRAYDIMAKNNVTSWYTECTRKQKYITETYGKFVKDPDPVVTKKFKRMLLYPELYIALPDWDVVDFEETNFIRKYGITAKMENDLRRSTKLLFKFLNKYKKHDKGKNMILSGNYLNPNYWVKLIFRALYEELENTNHQPSVFWLALPNMFEKTLPKFLKKHDLMKSHFVPLQIS